MNIAANHYWWRQLEHLRYFLYSCFFFFMPFTQALTFNVGFPLKFSELALLSLAFLYIAFNKKVQLPRAIIFLLSAFFFIITISVLFNVWGSYDYPLKEYETRFGYTGDSIARYVYFILALLAFVISVDIYLENTSKFINTWLVGATIAALYAWYLVTFSFLNMPVYLLPGMEESPQRIFGNVIRSGTFLEGNMMGLYLLVSGGMAFYNKKYKTGVFLFASVFITFSTLGVISVLLFFLLYFRNFILRKKYLPYFALGLAVFIPLFVSFTQTKFYKLNVHDKIFGSTTVVTNAAAYSRVDRVYLMKTAYNMGRDNPVLGVGLSNYSRHYDRYFLEFGVNTSLYKALARKNAKAIPNNIYAEIWAEAGGIALILFVGFLLQLLSYARTDKTKVLLPLLLCTYLCFNAYPSFIMIYLWAFMALPVADYIISSNRSRIPGDVNYYNGV